MTISELRKRHPELVYAAAKYSFSDTGLSFSATFKLEPDITLTPTVSFPKVTRESLFTSSVWSTHLSQISPAEAEVFLDKQLKKAAFEIGLAELPSYWKAACPANIRISAHQDEFPVSQTQLKYLKTLLTQGLGEFYFVNAIETFSDPDFITLFGDSEISQNHILEKAKTDPSTPPELDSYLLPLGGGKDSLVALEVLQRCADSGMHQAQLPKSGIFILNPASPATYKLAEFSHLPVYTAERVIDPKLLELNKQGYLNGHTPFSAYLAVLSSIAAGFFGYQSVVVANEDSANQGNSHFHGMEINHQWSKSDEFEHLFRNYAAENLATFESYYFSLLRPVNELQISRAFADFYMDRDDFLTTFRSCNRGQRQGIWCGECPKCLFAYMILSPFLDQAKLSAAFGQDLYQNESLFPTARDLLGKGSNKPLECVGMYEESLAAAALKREQLLATGEELPPLLKKIDLELLAEYAPAELKTMATELLSAWKNDRAIPDTLKNCLRKYLLRNT